MATVTSDDVYEEAVSVLQRLLGCGQPGTGIICGWDQPCDDALTYLGQAEIVLYGSPVISKLTGDPELQEKLRVAAKEANAYEFVDYLQREEINLDCCIDVEVEISFAAMHPTHRALHQLRTLLVNNYEWGGGDGHEWSISAGETIAADYADHPQAVLGAEWELRDWEEDEWEPLIKLLAGLGVNPTTLGAARGSDDGCELPEGDALEWVQEHNILGRIFPDVKNDDGKIARGIAFCIDGLLAERPAGDVTVLYLHDLYSQERDVALAGFVSRIGALTPIEMFAPRIQASPDLDTTNTILKELYAYAPTAGVWVV